MTRHAITPMTSEEAAEFAPQWGSMMTLGDPGACMYGFPLGDGRPQDNEHRRACLRYMRRMLSTVRLRRDREGPLDATDGDLDEQILEIQRFLPWMGSAPTREGKSAPNVHVVAFDAKLDGEIRKLTYGDILDAIEETDNDPFSLQVTDQTTWAAIAACVNQGIDSYLEAIENAKQEFNSSNGRCRISPGNLCILLRRCSSTNFRDSRTGEAASELMNQVLSRLGLIAEQEWQR